jgi:hypothetical protein
MPVPRSLLDSLRKIIPPLDGSLHKGQSGRVGVIGGAQEYVPALSLSSLSILTSDVQLHRCTVLRRHNRFADGCRPIPRNLRTLSSQRDQVLRSRLDRSPDPAPTFVGNPSHPKR